jgi:hypothetical protein
LSSLEDSSDEESGIVFADGERKEEQIQTSIKISIPRISSSL